MDFVIEPEMEFIIDSYYKNNARKMHAMVDKVLKKLNFYHVDKDDFYSLANEIFLHALKSYNKMQSFDGFLYSCLYKKFCSELTKRTRNKRCTKVKLDEKNENGKVIEVIKIVKNVSLDAPVCDDDFSYIETIANDFDIDKEAFQNTDDVYSEKMLLYLNRLSSLQREVLELLAEGYLPCEIQDKLHINKKQYTNCHAAIHSYRNISVLF